MTVADLHAAYPPSAAVRGKYARVSDYAGYIDRVFRCDYDSQSGLYFYTPTSNESGRSIAVTGNMNLDPLTSPAVVNLTGSIALGATRAVTLTTTYGRPGDLKTIKGGLSSLLGTLNIGGTGLGSLVSLGLGGTAQFVCEWDGSALKWTRIT